MLEELPLAAEMKVLCTLRGILYCRGNPWAVRLLLCFHVQLFLKFVFFLYLQNCILKINDGKKLPSSVITFANEIDIYNLEIKAIKAIGICHTSK